MSAVKMAISHAARATSHVALNLSDLFLQCLVLSAFAIAKTMPQKLRMFFVFTHHRLVSAVSARHSRFPVCLAGMVCHRTVTYYGVFTHSTIIPKSSSFSPAPRPAGRGKPLRAGDDFGMFEAVG